jgi:hypothetical protein
MRALEQTLAACTHRSSVRFYTVNADGSGLFQVTNTPDITEFNADWGIHRLTP